MAVRDRRVNPLDEKADTKGPTAHRGRRWNRVASPLGRRPNRRQPTGGHRQPTFFFLFRRFLGTEGLHSLCESGRLVSHDGRARAAAAKERAKRPGFDRIGARPA